MAAAAVAPAPVKKPSPWHWRTKPLFIGITAEGFISQDKLPSGEDDIGIMENCEVKVPNPSAWKQLIAKCDEVGALPHKYGALRKWVLDYTTFKFINYDPKLFGSHYATVKNTYYWHSLKWLIKCARVFAHAGSDLDHSDSDKSDSDSDAEDKDAAGASAGKELEEDSSGDEMPSLDEHAMIFYEKYGAAPSDEKTKYILEMYEAEKTIIKIRKAANKKFGRRVVVDGGAGAGAGAGGKRRRIDK